MVADLSTRVQPLADRDGIGLLVIEQSGDLALERAHRPMVMSHGEGVYRIAQLRSRAILTFCGRPTVASLPAFIRDRLELFVSTIMRADMQKYTGESKREEH